MPTKAQIESTTLALRKSVTRYNKAQLKLNKAQKHYEKWQVISKKNIHGWHSRDALKKSVQRWNKAKAEFDRAEKNWSDKAKKYKAVHSKLPHGHWMAD